MGSGRNTGKVGTLPKTKFRTSKGRDSSFSRFGTWRTRNRQGSFEKNMTNSKIVQLNDFLCGKCRLPSSTPICSHCKVNPERNTLKRSEDWQAFPWVLAIFGIGIVVLLVGMYAAANQ